MADTLEREDLYIFITKLLDYAEVEVLSSGT
jgi:hypothetical protein